MRTGYMRGWAAALVLIALAGCGGGGGERAGEGCLGPGNHWFDAALLHVPPGAVRSRPLVVAFHGGGQSGGRFALYSGLSRYADRHGFAVLYPTAAAENRFWSLNRRARPDDVPRVAALLRRAAPAACADPDRIYAAGFSNGGGFAVRAACELPQLAAVASVAGGYVRLDRCPSRRRTSLLAIHSTADDGVPYRGYGPSHRGDIRRFVAGWARRDGCGAVPRTVALGPRARRVSYGGCGAGLSVEHIVVLGDPHYWYEHSNTRVWRFLRAQRRP